MSERVTIGYQRLCEVRLDAQGFFKAAVFPRRFLLYDSLRMFYANGGGDCYIVSVGNYAATPDKAHFPDSNAGIQALEKYDEPTIILFPDAALLTDNGLYEIQAAALAQCEFLKDRVGLFDLHENDPKGDDFRSKSGTTSLKYGMTYTPWLTTTFPKGYTYRSISAAGVLQKADTATPPVFTAITLQSLTADAAILLTLAGLEKTMVDAMAATILRMPAPVSQEQNCRQPAIGHSARPRQTPPTKATGAWR